MDRMTHWIGFDLDGTLAHYDIWVDAHHIGEPIKPMVDLAKQYIAEGRYEVRIFTARVCDQGRAGLSVDVVRCLIEDWSEHNIGRRLRVTNIKDFGLVKLYDDRAVQVEKNTGRIIG
jgi:FMN phosphatase YigB (HAD superfamily)